MECHPYNHLKCCNWFTDALLSGNHLTADTTEQSYFILAVSHETLITGIYSFHDILKDNYKVVL